MRILILRDLTGRGPGGDRVPASRPVPHKTIQVDVDSFDSVMRRLAPGLEPADGSPGDHGAAVGFTTLDDFHPDALYRRLAIFEPMRTLRTRLLDPATAPAAMAELSPGRLDAPAAGSSPAAASPAGREVPGEDEHRMLERLLGPRPVNVARSAAELARQRINLDRFLRDLVAPHIVRGAGPAPRHLVESVDAAAGALMRALLHDPAFQSLEALWRSIHGLVVNLETGENLEVHLLDLPVEALESEVATAEADPAASGLHRLLVEGSPGDPGERPWSLLVGNYRFDAGEWDTKVLAALAAIAARAGAPLLAAADPRIVGCESLADSPDPGDWTPLEAASAARWATLRGSQNAGWVGLALPRVLLRLPYGRETDEIEEFGFEEMPGDIPRHEDYLWGNPAFACARLLGESFAGAANQPDGHLDLGDLPAHTRPTPDGPALQACAEAFLPERAADTILGCGLMPLMSFRNRNQVRLVRFQSIADPPAPLMGSLTT